MSITTLLLGRPLANREAEGRKIGLFAALPALGLDGLASAAYGPEAMLAVLVVAGAAGPGVVLPITWAILALLAMLCVSYWQTIAAYPSNGGSYTVARENLGPKAGLLAAAALMLDYMLNVAVGISAGVAALVSAVPALAPHTLTACLIILAVLTLVNLRGTRETGLLLAVPTYLFIGSLLAVLAAALWEVPAPVVPQPGGAVGVWLVLRAFAAGCTAMTGVEAVSNGVGIFRDPAVKRAQQTLVVICVVLGVLLLGIGHVVAGRGIQAMDQLAPDYQSVLSQLVSGVVGRGVLYNLTIGAVLFVLCLSANTSFVGFPRLCRLVAADGYLPHAFALPGRRLVYTAGVGFLAGGAGLLLVGFGGITDRLIPLFAVGAFLSFTLSQAGMAAHWLRERSGHVDHLRLAANGLGAIATGAALAIILVAKFTEGAWLTVLIIPATLGALLLVRRYYRQIERQMLVGSRRAVDWSSHAPPAVLVLAERWDRRMQSALTLAARLSPDVVALHLTDLEGPDAEAHEGRLQQEWTRFVSDPAAAAGLPAPVLLVQSSPYRSVLAPLLREVAALQDQYPGRPAIVVLTELAGARWWEALLHTGRIHRLRRQLLDCPGVSVLVVPWYLDPPTAARETAAALAEEEPAQ